MTADTQTRSRLSRRKWLALAMDVLSTDGGARLNITPLCQKLRVTKGSFYAHFESQADFVEQLIGYWEEAFTQSVITRLEEMHTQPAGDRLLKLMQLLHDNQLARYDIAFRAWAAQDLSIARGVEQVDRRRFEYVRSLLQEMGFSGSELDVRTRLFVVYHSSNAGMRLPPSRLEADDEIRLRHAILTRQSQ